MSLPALSEPSPDSRRPVWQHRPLTSGSLRASPPSRTTRPSGEREEIPKSAAERRAMSSLRATRAIASLAPVTRVRPHKPTLSLVAANAMVMACCGVAEREDAAPPASTVVARQPDTYEVTITFRVAASELEDMVATQLGDPRSVDVRVMPA